MTETPASLASRFLPLAAHRRGAGDRRAGGVGRAPRAAPGSHWSPAEFVAASAFALWLALVMAVGYCKWPGLSTPAQPLGVACALLMPLLIGAAGAWACTDRRGPGHALHPPRRGAWQFIGSVARCRR
jgi:hypothetical protein